MIEYSKGKKNKVKFGFYELPEGEAALVFRGKESNILHECEEQQYYAYNLMQVGVCRRGNGKIHMKKGSLIYHESDIVIIPENLAHIIVSRDEYVSFWEYFFIDIHAVIKEIYPEDYSLQNEMTSRLNKKISMMNMRQNPTVANCINSIIKEDREHKAFFKRVMSDLVQVLVIELLRECGHVDGYKNEISKVTYSYPVGRAIEYMNKNYFKSLKVGEISELCGMSETHFRKIFESNINMSPMDYLNYIRVQKACEIIKMTDEPMNIIAKKCGFLTQSTFNRNFRKFFNTTPYQWKIMMKNGD